MSDHIKTQINSSRILMLCGSRYASDELLQVAEAAVLNCQRLGWQHILVGDAPGVDSVVVQTCERINMPYLAVGITPNPRNQATNYKWILASTAGRAGYEFRDRWLADHSATAICIWNGESRGTLATYNYMRGQGKPVLLVTNGTNDPQWPGTV